MCARLLHCARRLQRPQRLLLRARVGRPTLHCPAGCAACAGRVGDGARSAALHRPHSAGLLCSPGWPRVQPFARGLVAAASAGQRWCASARQQPRSSSLSRRRGCSSFRRPAMATPPWASLSRRSPQPAWAPMAHMASPTHCSPSGPPSAYVLPQLWTTARPLDNMRRWTPVGGLHAGCLYHPNLIAVDVLVLRRLHSMSLADLRRGHTWAGSSLPHHSHTLKPHVERQCQRPPTLAASRGARVEAASVCQPHCQMPPTPAARLRGARGRRPSHTSCFSRALRGGPCGYVVLACVAGWPRLAGTAGPGRPRPSIV